MKTFLGFTTGLLTGVLLGIGYTAIVVLKDENVREYIEKTAIDLENE